MGDHDSYSDSMLNDDDVWIVGAPDEQRPDPALPPRLEKRRLVGRGGTGDAALDERNDARIGRHAIEPGGQGDCSAGVNTREADWSGRSTPKNSRPRRSKRPAIPLKPVSWVAPVRKLATLATTPVTPSSRSSRSSTRILPRPGSVSG